MTWTVTARTADDPGNGSGDVTTASFTPSANSVLVCAYASSNDGDVSSISGHGTWSRVGSIVSDIGDGTVDFEIWACRVGGSPSAGTVTISRSAYIYRNTYEIFDLTETAGINGTTVGDAFGTPATSGGYYGGGSPHTITATLSAFAQSTNLTLVFGIIKATFGATRWNTDTGYTELEEWSSGDFNFSNATHYIGSEDTSASMLLAVDSIDADVIAVEVKHAAGGGGGGTNTTIIVPTGPALS